MRPLLLVLLLVSGCGLAAGPFHGPHWKLGTPNSGTGVASLGPGSKTGVSASVSDRMGYGVGTMPGYCRLSMKAGGVETSESGTCLHVYVSPIFHFTRRAIFSFNLSFDRHTLAKVDTDVGAAADEHTAFNTQLEYIYAPSKRLQLWFGGGLRFGTIGAYDVGGPRGVVGAQVPVTELGIGVTMLLRVEGFMVRGANDFAHEGVNAGLVFWLDPGR